MSAIFFSLVLTVFLLPCSPYLHSCIAVAPLIQRLISTKQSTSARLMIAISYWDCHTWRYDCRLKYSDCLMYRTSFAHPEAGRLITSEHTFDRNIQKAAVRWLLRFACIKIPPATRAKFDVSSYSTLQPGNGILPGGLGCLILSLVPLRSKECFLCCILVSLQSDCLVPMKGSFSSKDLDIILTKRSESGGMLLCYCSRSNLPCCSYLKLG